MYIYICMYIYIYIYIYIYTYIYIYILWSHEDNPMRPSSHPPHHDNGFLVTCRLWTASSGVHALLKLHQQSAQQAPGKEHKYIN